MLGDVEIFISASSFFAFTLVFLGTELKDFKVERRKEKYRTGAFLKGLVKKECPALDGFFLDVGLTKEALLQEKKNCKNLRIGDSVIVQLKRKERDLKGAKVTCKVSIPGKYIVYFPETKKLNFSKKLKGFAFTEDLKKILKEELNDREGVIIRASAISATKEQILKELQELRNKWESLKEKAKKVNKGILEEGQPQFIKTILDYWGFIKNIYVDNGDVWGEIVEFFGDSIKHKLRYVNTIDTLPGGITLNQLIDKLTSKTVWLKNGGFIVIEQTEALTSIDVNSGETCGKSLEETAYNVNLEALKEVAKQIKFRNLSGIIIVDLIDMKKEKTKESLLSEVKKIFEGEGLRIKIYGITKLGLLEMTKKWESESIYEVIGETCPHCQGKGFVKSKEFILHTLEKALEKTRGKKIVLKVHPSLAKTVEEFINEKNLKDWITIKEVWEERSDYFQLSYSDYY